MSQASGFEKWYMRGVVTFFSLVLIVPAIIFIPEQLSEPEVGDCAEPVAESEGGFDMDETNCTAREAAYRLVRLDRKRGCPEGDYLARSERAAGKSGGRKYFCFVLNAAEGDCFKRGDAFHERVACGTSGAQRVLKVARAHDRALCGDREARVYPDPAMTVCLEKA